MPEYIRPLFCLGKGPFRWAALSGKPQDIYATDEAVLKEFPEDEALARWIRKARSQVKFQGLPARICWLGYGERARFGAVINRLVKTGKITAPIVIGRDHLDTGSVASPNRETEGMRDGSDAIADWPILNALLNAVSGASWVSVHHGGGVGIGLSIHAGMVIVADGTAAMGRRLERVLTVDPGHGRRPPRRRRLPRSDRLREEERHQDPDDEVSRRRRPLARRRGLPLPRIRCRQPAVSQTPRASISILFILRELDCSETGRPTGMRLALERGERRKPMRKLAILALAGLVLVSAAVSYAAAPT